MKKKLNSVTFFLRGVKVKSNTAQKDKIAMQKFAVVICVFPASSVRAKIVAPIQQINRIACIG
jgi:hypothetical protein